MPVLNPYKQYDNVTYGTADPMSLVIVTLTLSIVGSVCRFVTIYAWKSATMGAASPIISAQVSVWSPCASERRNWVERACSKTVPDEARVPWCSCL